MTEPRYLPVALRLDGASVLVIGGGNVAANKIRLLLPRSANITVLSPDLAPEIVQWREQGRLSHLAQAAEIETLSTLIPRMRLVFAATDDESVNRIAARIARDSNIPVCAVDDPEPSTFITPAIVDRHPVQIAISTGGAAPVLARRLRTQIETLVPEATGALARFMQARRSWIRRTAPDGLARRRAWEDFVDGPGAEAALRGDEAQADQALAAAVQGAARQGEVWLVGAGPGDPDLLTLGALRLMQNADCVLYDQLIPEPILERVRRDAERVFVGKRMSHHIMPQGDINAEMIRRARMGQRVLRLKGGDPFVFGRGGEEMAALAEAGVTVRVMPGVTAASGCGAYAGIPLTHRDCAQACLLVTGHARADGTLDLPWDSIARRGQTVVFYMGLSSLRELCAALMAHGLPGSWPAAVVERGTQPGQQVITGTLQTLPDHAVQARSPALIIVGEVVEKRVVL
jgi:uroporphyrin-III C-methyltransferase / precorrin-2 dehydrogenase / sirohydrochlorin ferrochelatase